MSEYEIETGIEIPGVNGTGKQEKYPFSKMEVGDSFFVLTNTKSLRGAAYAASKRLNRKYATRRIEGGGIRVWRTQ